MNALRRVLVAVSQAMALIGGTVLLALVVMVCASITGRSLNGFLNGDFAQALPGGLADAALGAGVGPILGDFELVEAGVAFCIFAFLPLCQVSGGHASVDLFTTHLPARVQRGIAVVTEVLLTAALILIAWRLYYGMLDRMRFNETTFLLQFPVWWAYAASLLGGVTAAAVGLGMCVMRTAEAIQNRDLMAAEAAEA